MRWRPGCARCSSRLQKASWTSCGASKATGGGFCRRPPAAPTHVHARTPPHRPPRIADFSGRPTRRCPTLFARSRRHSHRRPRLCLRRHPGHPRDCRPQNTPRRFIGQRCLREFGDEQALATITKWLPADEAKGEPTLFRCVHDDGDEEDLEQEEATEAIKAFELCNGRRTGGLRDTPSLRGVRTLRAAATAEAAAATAEAGRRRWWRRRWRRRRQAQRSADHRAGTITSGCHRRSQWRAGAVAVRASGRRQEDLGRPSRPSRRRALPARRSSGLSPSAAIHLTSRIGWRR